MGENDAVQALRKHAGVCRTFSEGPAGELSRCWAKRAEDAEAFLPVLTRALATERAAIAAAVRDNANHLGDAIRPDIREAFRTLADSIEAGQFAKGRDDGKSE